MSQANRFGRIVSPYQIEKAMAATIALWVRDYLEEQARIDGYDPAQIDPGVTIITRSEFERWSEEQIPAVLVMCSDLAGKPVRRAQGVYEASWMVGVAPIVSDVDQEATRKLAETWVTALRTLILQHKMLKSSLHPAGFADFTSWEGENYDVMPSLAERSLGSAQVMFSVGIENAVTEQAGPRTPSATPWIDPGQWPLIREDGVTVIPVPVSLEDSVA